MELLAFQLLSLGTLLAISVIGVLLPFFFPTGTKGDTLLSLGNSFAGAYRTRGHTSTDSQWGCISAHICAMSSDTVCNVVVILLSLWLQVV